MKNAKPLLSTQGLSAFQRPRFSPGLLLEDEDLNAGVDYTHELMRTMLRSLFGCGVVCGLEVTAEWICERRKVTLGVSCGVALDCMGNAIIVPKAQTLTYDPQCDPMPDVLWVVACYKEQSCRPRDASCAADDPSQVSYTRVQEAFEIRLYDHRPDGACTCAPADPAPPVDPDDCCTDDATPPVKDPQPAATDEDECPCYSKHFHGECCCGCDCNCVVIGKITLKERSPHSPHFTDALRTEPDTSDRHKVVREIRPVLNGYMKCRFPKRKHTQGTTEPERRRSSSASRKKDDGGERQSG